MKMNRKLCAILLIATMLFTTAFAGCSKKSDVAEDTNDAGQQTATTDTGDSADAGEQPDSSSEEQITLKFWHAQSDPALQDYFDKYTETHPNVKIEQTVFVDDDYKTQSRIALAGGETPDVWYMNTGSSLDQFVGSNGLMDISKYADQYGWKDGYDATSLQCTSIGDKLYGLPWSTYTPWMVLWANKNFFETNNLEYPKTVDDLVALAPKIRELGQEPVVFYNKDGWTGAILFGEYVLQQVGPEWIEGINSGELKWTDNEVAKTALETLKKLSESNVLLTGYETQRQDTALAVWKNQQSPLMYNGTWFTQNIGRDFDFDVECLRLPMLTEDTVPKGYQNWLDWCLGVCPNTKYPDQAVEFVNYAAGEGVQEILGNTLGNLTAMPAVNEKVDVPYYFKTEPILEQLDKPKTQFFCYAFATEVCNALQDQIKLVMAGQTSVDDALAAIQKVQDENYN